MDTQLFLGEHYIAEFFDCQFQKLDDPTEIEKNFLECAEICNATVICSKFHHFNPFGVSGVVVIAESHMTIHTWPEFRYAAVDVFTCSTKMKSGRCVEVLAEKFKCENQQVNFIPRGFLKNLQITPEEIEKSRDLFINPETRTKEVSQDKVVSESWIYELGKYSKLGIPYSKMLYHKKSEFQDVKILESPTMGRTLLLDNVFMICEKTEENYHQMMVHPSVQILLQKGKKVLDVLIIGGGDGGAARELLRYPQVNRIKVAELDGDVIESCRQFIPKTAKSFDDPRVELAVGDGLAFVANTTETWDLILCDGCDPIGEGCNLFSDSFYFNCHKILREDGIFLTQGESSYAYQEQFLKTHKHLKDIFGVKNTSLLCYHQPLYEFGLWSFQLAIKDQEECDLREYSKKVLNEEQINEFADKHDLQYYDYEAHIGSMTLNRRIRKLLQKV